MSDLISMDKQYRTRDGREVEVLKVGVNHRNFPVAVVVTNKDGSQLIGTRTSTGRMYSCKENPSDLVEVKPRIKQTVWMNIYSNGRPRPHFIKEEADINCMSDRIACVKIEIDCEHGEGL